MIITLHYTAEVINLFFYNV